MHLEIIKAVRGLALGQRLKMDRYFGRGLVAEGIAKEVEGNDVPRKKRTYKRRDMQAEQPE